MPGTLLGPYEILAPLGAGGMGEVYRARDTRLTREVAIKVLPTAFATDFLNNGAVRDPLRSNPKFEALTRRIGLPSLPLA
jgi:serine/threonine protein kinase